MSLSEHDSHTLESIEHELAESDPRLASMMAGFSRMTAGESMPARERIPSRATRTHHPSLHFVLITLWLAVTVILIAAGVLLNRYTGNGPCTARQTTACVSHPAWHASAAQRLPAASGKIPARPGLPLRAD